MKNHSFSDLSIKDEQDFDDNIIEQNLSSIEKEGLFNDVDPSLNAPSETTVVMDDDGKDDILISEKDDKDNEELKIGSPPIEKVSEDKELLFFLSGLSKKMNTMATEEKSFPGSGALFLTLAAISRNPQDALALDKLIIGVYKNKLKACANCDKKGCTLKCSQCKQVLYCDKQCQLSDFDEHKILYHSLDKQGKIN